MNGIEVFNLMNDRLGIDESVYFIDVDPILLQYNKQFYIMEIAVSAFI